MLRSRASVPLAILLSFGCLVSSGREAAAQAVPADVAAERAAYRTWLRTAPNSPFAAIVLRPIGPGLTLGPKESDLPLDGLAPSRLEDGRLAMLEEGGRRRPLPRHRAIPVGKYRLLVAGPPGRGTVTVFGPVKAPKEPAYYPYAARHAYEVRLVPPARARGQRLLSPDGTEVEATEAGTVTLTVGGERVTLRVMRFPVTGGEASDLEIYVRDGTNGHGTYPAGRFVTLLPAGRGMYRLDFNRARNAFCAYNTVFPCPAPWRGNLIEAPVEAGERYTGGGLEVPIPTER